MYQVGYKRGTKWWLIGAVVCLALVFLYWRWGNNFLTNWFIQLAGPAQGALTEAGTAAGGFKTKAVLTEENQVLKAKLEQLALDVSQLKVLEVENQLLRQQLNFVEGKGYHFVTARITSRVAENSLSGLIINRGRADGIQVGYPVIAGEGVLVGTIIEVQENFSTLLLLTDSQSRVAATVQNQQQTVGIMEGEHGISVKLTMIPQDEKIDPGQTIITSGLQSNIPRGLFLGLVDKVEANASELFAKAYIYPLVDYQRLSLVTVLIP
ncbi:MAG: rod shape-determining protein MreC [Patescibacteria group bacterium]|jgi:rod shape-determining protein MreC